MGNKPSFDREIRMLAASIYIQSQLTPASLKCDYLWYSGFAKFIRDH
jgi:hypothetical protein